MEGDDNNRRELPGPLDTSDLVINYYALALGENALGWTPHPP